ncbi:DNA mismatch repair protein MutS [Alistipes communis]|uniref:DNA mismatch repair protein MutS n=1 Tax=Alistipes communis TaxID=2585118 RepID=UPI001D07B1CE|nr:DNA mismatch repair protein MutS [Alistipes communis]MCB6995549.1 DNA mismatch repair protein MutS [Alistipes communis]
MAGTDKKYVETPLMKQYYQIKSVHPDAILLFRVGDFYETFGDDAIKASGILGITLTRRANGAATFVELAGFPYHAIDTYLPKLVRAGERVAICEQLEDPKLVKGLVKRGVIELVTPGVVLGDNLLANKENVYLASVYFGRQTTGVAFLDISTGEFYVAEGPDNYIDKLLSNLSPKEIIYQRGFDERFRQAFGTNYYTYKLDDWVFSEELNREKLCKQFGTQSLKGFGIDHISAGISAAGAILYYLEFTEHKEIGHIASISRIDQDDYVWIDKFTIRNLELFTTNGSRDRSSFANVMDRTLTPMGGRLLKRWIAMPIRDIGRINRRLDVVQRFVEDSDLAEAVGEQVSLIGDLERIASRIAAARVTPRELVQLKNSLAAIELLKAILESTDDGNLHRLAAEIDVLAQMRLKLEREIYPDPANNQIQKGGVIADGVNPELDDLRRIALHGKDVLQQIQQRESELTGIPSLKIGYNNIFGYFIEVRNAHKEKVPDTWIRKQTLSNAERYITEELKEYEEKILGAEDRILTLEQEIYNALIAFVSQSLSQLLRDAHAVARVDCFLSFARIARERNYVRPELDDGARIDIEQGRHPVIETLMPVGEKYIPNDIRLDDEEQQIVMITGPNMSGKSALLRQTALIILMAQMGSFVPARRAHIGVVDKIFTRVGASDNISQGESTFMVEMLESASILNNISDRSIVLLDEIGRGTSTYDGISIAWAMVEYLHNHPTAHARTLFATHYHELNEMEKMYPRVKNYHVTVKEMNNTIVFLRKLERGGTEHSFGIHVAKMAGMPASVVSRADEILKNLVKVYGTDEIVPSKSPKLRGRKQASVKDAVEEADKGASMQLSMFQLDDPVLVQIRDQIKGLDIDSLTPLEALNKLNEIKKIAGI